MSLFESPRNLNSLQEKESISSSRSTTSSTVDLLHSSDDDDQDDDASIQTVYKEIQCKECHSERVLDSDEIIYEKHHWFDSVKLPLIDDIIMTTTASAASNDNNCQRNRTTTTAVVTHSGKKRRRTEDRQEYDLINQLDLNKDNFSTPDRNRNGTQHVNRNEDALQETRQGTISPQVQQRTQNIEIERGGSSSTTGNGTSIASTSQPQHRSNKQTRSSDDVIELLESDDEQPTNANQSKRNVIELLDSDNEDTHTMDQRSLDRIHNRRRRNRQRNRNRRNRGNNGHAATTIDVDLTLE
ncbi:predicted protein [Chaetoceros tenuissimus]|uniref:Uncharacterized protein n=1 Tax=Chaetoceros tenuissimus TaxID=426638 RepID=A0AAD3CF65_9STRA|nr:predicted protein [Chaetoceros tenuissimus]